MSGLDVSGRHPATQQIYRWFSYDHLPLRLQSTSRSCAFLAERWIAATCALRGRFPEAFCGTPLEAP